MQWSCLQRNDATSAKRVGRTPRETIICVAINIYIYMSARMSITIAFNSMRSARSFGNRCKRSMIDLQSNRIRLRAKWLWSLCFVLCVLENIRFCLFCSWLTKQTTHLFVRTSNYADCDFFHCRGTNSSTDATGTGAHKMCIILNVTNYWIIILFWFSARLNLRGVNDGPEFDTRARPSQGRSGPPLWRHWRDGTDPVGHASIREWCDRRPEYYCNWRPTVWDIRTRKWMLKIRYLICWNEL